MAIDAHLKIEGAFEIKGESKVKGHEDQIQLLSYSFGVSNRGSRHESTGGGTEKGDFGDMSFMVKNSKALPLLFLAAASGKHIDKATLYVSKAGGDDPVVYLEVEMKDCLISSWQTSASEGGDVGMETFSLNFAEVKVTYRGQKADGTAEPDVTQGWKIAVGEKI
ncbi:Hcp family type VI secretion system effector [Mesorhizobium sp. AaZ16]|uniref:Hcp family type VI secretion system effector n=1 Tax=Mesorhizobium sp. AaZ16 TaxID=3402289 RepID=UPI00374E2EE8